MSKPEFFRVGEEYELECQSRGSKPAAEVTWYKGHIAYDDQLVRVYSVFQLDLPGKLTSLASSRSIGSIVPFSPSDPSAGLPFGDDQHDKVQSEEVRQRHGDHLQGGQPVDGGIRARGHRAAQSHV